MRSPAGAVEAQVTVKGSRFQAWLGPANDIETARSAVAQRTRAHPDATHHGWAFRVWKDGRVEGAGFDAGEPAGTTGRPILGALERSEVVSAVCVVSRWFGGTKLGTGGTRSPRGSSVCSPGTALARAPRTTRSGWRSSRRPARAAPAFERDLADGSSGAAVVTRIDERLAPRA